MSRACRIKNAALRDTGTEQQALAGRIAPPPSVFICPRFFFFSWTQILLLSCRFRVEKFSHNIHNGWMKIQIRSILQHCVLLTLLWYVQGFFLFIFAHSMHRWWSLLSPLTYHSVVTYTRPAKGLTDKLHIRLKLLLYTCVFGSVFANTTQAFRL